MDLMFAADKAEQEANEEANNLRDMQNAPSYSEAALFDNRAGQRRVWMGKSEVALQVKEFYQAGIRRMYSLRLGKCSVFLLQSARRLGTRRESLG